MQTATLSGSWEFRRSGDERWREATVPGGIYGDLLSAGEIDDPYENDNELDLQWVGESDWEYRRVVTVGESLLDHERVVLQCDGLDTVATVYVNGEIVGGAENMFRRHVFDVADALTAGENEVRIRFRSPVEYAAERAADHPYDVPTLRYPVDQPARNFIRKAQCHFGWDWGPCLPTVGIWRDLRLVAHSSPRIDHVTPVQRHGQGDVELDVRVGLSVPTPGEYEVSAAVDGTDASASRRVTLDGDGEVALSMTVEKPELWWPAGRGDQPLYDLGVTVEGDVAHSVAERIGFRDVELVRPPDGDGDGEGFHLRVNGEPIFARGANWIPADAMYRNVTTETYDDLLSSAVDANMNAVRVWGGGYYERDAFYRLCDEKGLLVWQDFMFSCALYPGDDAFVNSVEAEARYQVRRLSTHPSVALWCGNNELEVGVESWFADSDHIDRLEDDYDELFRETLGAVVDEENPSCPYWSASPSSGPDRLDPEDEGRGDIHYWGVWHEGKPFSAFLETEPRFVSEFGYQSFPSVETLADVVPADQHNPTAPLMEHHQRNEGGNKRILQRMADHFRMPSDFDDFVYLSQIQQGLAIRTAVEHWRRRKPHCMGTLYWQLNDLWQCASWSSVEYGGEWKALHHIARRFYEPTLVSMVEDEEDLELWVTNDGGEPISGTVRVDAVTVDGEHLFETAFAAEVHGDGSDRIGTVDVGTALGDAARSEVLFRATPVTLGSASSAYHTLVPYKRLSLPDSDLELTVRDGNAIVRAPKAALFVELRSDGRGRFEDNYFHLAPGEERTLAYESERDVSDEELEESISVRHLAETY
ncbi:glycoside hydrolase family 2 sugar binding protein [Haladaptatus paucihalophilus DX253]|uniref:Beta-mannosidase B n=1 Tax=Haladaptatus paucihalophilus DX253 TaxID=797209 RepID=E7QZD1_HALPU|nr:glycoside hydrolase family 2 protein [Haladaptatus paucihalophilus]EFW90052.1 glycoside hydrolase family 2 sugar binding protein [Haladaptatus paucihalophilus DX253]SHL03824.1 beta-mannosidase [Haladaptatus paucihalophilus DX253]